MNSVVLCNPTTILEEHYKSNREVAFLKTDFLVAWDHVRDTRNINEIIISNNIDSEIDIATINIKIDWWMPIWHRWVEDVHNYELYRQSCLLYIIGLAQLLKKEKVKYAVFFTSVSHHVQPALWEIACQVVGVKQIYLYSVPFGRKNRLLPLVQNHSIYDREPISFQISNHNSFHDIELFKDRAFEGKPPLFNQNYSNKEKNFFFTTVSVFMSKFWRIGGIILRFLAVPSQTMSSSKSATYAIPNKNRNSRYRISTLLKLIVNQRKALAYYSSTIADNSHVTKLIEETPNLPIVFAHQQPESTSFPEGACYNNHIDLIVKIRNLGYRGKILYKEHPASSVYKCPITGTSRVGMYRSREYYKQLEELGCVLIDSDYHLPGKFYDRVWPITITGSIVIERSMMGLPTVYVGEPWYKGCPGAYRLNDVIDDEGGFFDAGDFVFDGVLAMSWFDKYLSNKTINNAFGIATGKPIVNGNDFGECLSELSCLINQLVRKPYVSSSNGQFVSS